MMCEDCNERDATIRLTTIVNGEKVEKNLCASCMAKGRPMQARAPVIVDLNKRELGAFMEVMEPEGIFLWIASENEEEELELLKRISRWTG